MADGKVCVEVPDSIAVKQLEKTCFVFNLEFGCSLAPFFQPHCQPRNGRNFAGQTVLALQSRRAFHPNGRWTRTLLGKQRCLALVGLNRSWSVTRYLSPRRWPKNLASQRAFTVAWLTLRQSPRVSRKPRISISTGSWLPWIEPPARQCGQNRRPRGSQDTRFMRRTATPPRPPAPMPTVCMRTSGPQGPSRRSITQATRFGRPNLALTPP